MITIHDPPLSRAETGPRPPPRALALAVLVVAASVACVESQESGDSSTGPAARDSSGTHIVENPAPLNGAGWSVSEEPIAVLGGSGEDVLWRVVGATMLTTGDVVVANRGTNEVLWFTETGELTRRAGGEGDGPGEFQSITHLIPLPADSVAVVDTRQRRVSILDPSGDFVRSFSVVPEGMAVPVAWLGEGSYLLTTTGYPIGTTGPTRVEWLDREVSVVTPDEGTSTHLATLPWMETVVRTNLGTVGGMERSPREFGRRTFVVGDERGWVFANSAKPELVFHSSGADIVVRWAAPPRTVRPGALQQLRDDRLARIEDPTLRQDIAAVLAESPGAPDTAPYFGAPRTGALPRSLMLDQEGNVLVLTFSDELETSADQYLVFRRDGVWLGMMEAPTGLSVLSVGDETIVGVTTDDLGVERAQLHRLVKAP